MSVLKAAGNPSDTERGCLHDRIMDCWELAASRGCPELRAATGTQERQNWGRFLASPPIKYPHCFSQIKSPPLLPQSISPSHSNCPFPQVTQVPAGWHHHWRAKVVLWRWNTKKGLSSGLLSPLRFKRGENAFRLKVPTRGKGHTEPSLARCGITKLHPWKCQNDQADASPCPVSYLQSRKSAAF